MSGLPNGPFQRGRLNRNVDTLNERVPRKCVQFHVGILRQQIVEVVNAFRRFQDVRLRKSLQDFRDELLAAHVDKDFLAEIAAEYAKGRLLLIGTTNLDARRPNIWNIGAIASSGDPGAVALVRKILIASAAIPAAFPPVMIDVEVDGKKYQEMHVDGGALRQVFLYPIRLEFGRESQEKGMGRDRTAYVIRNARLDPDWAATQRQTLKIASRAISALIASQGVGDLYRVYLTTRRDGIDFNLAFIPAEFNLVPKEDFDPEYMKPLFELGRRDMLEGKAWHKSPPGFDESDLAPLAPK